MTFSPGELINNDKIGMLFPRDFNEMLSFHKVRRLKQSQAHFSSIKSLSEWSEDRNQAKLNLSARKKKKSFVIKAVRYKAYEMYWK